MHLPCCPDQKALLEYVVGTLSEDDAERLEGHLSACPGCVDAIASLEGHSDTLLDALRTRSETHPREILSDPVLREAVDKARAMRPGSPAPTCAGDLALIDPLADPSAREQFGQYRVLERIGQGGMGTVYRAVHRRLDKPVALKVLPTAEARSAEMAARFEREMLAIGRLEHPNLVRAYDAGESADGRFLFLAMELVEGEDLGKWVKRRGPLPVAEACEIVRQAAVGLDYIHRQGLVHRDIKPSNLMLRSDGTVKVLDLGLALLGERQRDELSGCGRLMGTLDFMAPEQARDSHEVDPRADVYSLGCTLYLLLAGKAPYAGGTETQVLLAHQQAPVPSLRGTLPEVSDALDAVCRKMLAKRPEDRQPSMAEVIAELDAALGRAPAPASAEVESAKAPTDAVPEACPRRKPPFWSRRAKRLAAGFAALGAVALLAVVIYLRNSDGTSTKIVAPDGSEVTVEYPDSRQPAPGQHRPPPAAAEAPRTPAGSPQYQGTVKFDLDVRDFPPHRVIVQIDNDAYVGAELTAPVSLRAGDHTVSVKDGDEEIHRLTFIVAPAERQVIRLIAPDRRAAEWALSMRGSVEIQPLRGDVKEVKRSADLPDSRFRLIRVVVDYNPDLKGDDLENLSGLRNLDSVTMRGSAGLTDAGFKYIEDLTSLTEIDFASSPNLSDAGCAYLTKLKNLKVVFLYNCPLSDRGLHALRFAENMELLCLHNTQVSEEAIIEFVTSHKKLASMGFDGTAFGNRALAKIASCRRLQKLDVNRTHVTDEGLRHLVGQDSLWWLGIGGTRVSREGLSAAFRGLPKLRILLLRGLPWFSGADIETLRPLQNLETLDLRETAITDRGMHDLLQFKNLTYLSLERTSVTDAALEELVKLPKVRVITLIGTKVTEAGLAKARSALPQCVFAMKPTEPLF